MLCFFLPQHLSIVGDIVATLGSSATHWAAFSTICSFPILCEAKTPFSTKKSRKSLQSVFPINNRDRLSVFPNPLIRHSQFMIHNSLQIFTP